MRSLLTLVLATLLSLNAFAATQSIDCHPADSNKADRISIILKSAQKGTFTFQSSLDQDEPSVSLKRIPSDTAGQSAFMALESMPGTEGSISFTFEMPEALVMQASPSFKAALTTAFEKDTKSKMQAWLCSAHL